MVMLSFKRLLGCIMKEDGTKQVILYSILLTIGIFIFDLLTPLGVAGGVPYVAVVLISFYLPRRRYTVIAGIVGTILTILGFFLSPTAPPGIKLWIVLINRSLALFVIWSAVILVTKYKGSLRLIKEDEEALRQAHSDLKRYADELKRSNAELEQFAYVASHDLQEPLRMVSSFTQLLSKRYKDKLDTDASEFISYAVEGANRMQRLINNLLSYSRINTKGKPFEETDCEEILGHVRANLHVAIEKSGALITNDHLPIVMGDASQLMRLFQNLIDNAVKFSDKEAPRIHVSAEAKDNEWLFSVRDNGIGIDPQYHERIFLIFQRLHGKEEYPGTGIGLAICKRIVERHGGRIWVEQGPQNGTVFYFTIPIGVHKSDALITPITKADYTDKD
ncbi:MAG: GHKL domain-containing protein [Nitrospirae bacterium]|nr:GHKL domain-containing protein [Nitrospirota bacterium]